MNITDFSFEFSHEKNCNHPISPEEYEIYVMIPQSKKYIGCIKEDTIHTSNSNDNSNNTVVLEICELNRFKKVCNVERKAVCNQAFQEIGKWISGTVFYGSMVENTFIMEDILFYKNVSSKNMIFEEKMFIEVMLIEYCNKCVWWKNEDTTTATLTSPCPPPTPTPTRFSLPVILKNEQQESVTNTIYPIHHIQCRSLKQLKPILNINVSKTGVLQFTTGGSVVVGNGRGNGNGLQQSYSKISTTNTNPIPSSYANNNNNNNHTYTHTHSFYTHPPPPPYPPSPNMDFKKKLHKPQYKKRTVLRVMSDVQTDIYKLYACGNNGEDVYIGVAHIPDHQTSKYMNSIFRKIKENDNLDYIEESDDEEDFENMDIYKFVDLSKRVNMECIFNHKFKKWVPVKICDFSTRIVSVNYL